MLVGQYSVGKTSFIRYLIGRDFPGQRIGPEPTTDRYILYIIHRPSYKVYKMYFPFFYFLINSKFIKLSFDIMNMCVGLLL